MNLEKEREVFEQWQYSMASNTASINGFYVNERASSEWFAWKKRANLAQAEITEIKQKLARYENPDCVLFPRSPTKEILKAMENGNYSEHGWSHYFGEDAYKAMIKAVEKDDD